MSTACLALCPSPLDELEALGDQIALLAAHLEAAHYRLLLLLREFDERQGWVASGAKSCAHWLAFRVGIGAGAARERVRVARALAALPRVSRALEGGELSFAKVRALTRVATPENEAELLTFAQHATASQLEKIVRRYRGVLEAEATQTESGRQDARHLRLWTDEQGMLRLEGRLPPEEGAFVQKALELAMAELQRAASAQASSSGQGAAALAPACTPAQRRADALGLLSRSALDHRLQRGSAADQTQVVLHVDAEALQKAKGQGQGECAFERGGNVSAETARRLSCDASVVTLLHGEKGRVLSVGRKTRTIPPAIRRALEAREPSCAFPGCQERRFLQAHHLEHWADGGETKLENLAELCFFHHELVHEGGFRVSRSPDGTLAFFRPDGRPLVPSAKAPRIEDGEHALVLENQRLGHELSKNTIRTGSGERCDYGEAVDILLRARDRATAIPALSPQPQVVSVESDEVSSTEAPETAARQTGR